MANNKVTQEIEVKAKADGALTTLKDLKKAIQEAVKGLEGNIKLNVDSSAFDKSLGQVQKKIDKLSQKKVTIIVDNKSALTAISEVRKALDGIKTKTLNIGIGNASRAADRINKISNALNKLNKDTVVDVKSSGLADVENRVKNVSKQLGSIDKNLNISVSLNDGGALNTLTKIRDLLVEIKRNSNINIRTTASDIITRRVVGSNSRDRSTRRRGSREHQVGDLLREQERQTSENNYGVASANIIYSVGRASKGFGSALEVASYHLGEFSKKSSGIGVAATSVTASLAVFTALSATFTSLIGITTSLGNALGQLTSFIFQILRPGIDMYTSKTKATYGMAAAIKSQGYINGKGFAEYYGDKATNTALAMSTKLLNRAMLDAEKSVFDFSEIISSLQGTLPMLMSRGMSLDQAYEVNKGIASAAKTLQLAPNQVLQETRDIAQNSITSRSSQVANALHITNAELKQFGDDVEARFDYLMKKFANYREMLEQYALTPVGAFERMRDRLLQVGSNIVEELAPMFMGLFNNITNLTGKWVDKQGNILDTVTNKWKQEGKDYGVDDNGNQVSGGLDREAGEATLQWAEALEKAKVVLVDLIEKTAQYTDGLIFFIEKLTDSEDPIEAIGKLLEGLISTFFSLVEFTMMFGEVCVAVFDISLASAMMFIRAVQSIIKTLNVSISTAKVFGYTMAKALVDAVDKLPDGVKKFFGIGNTSSKSAQLEVGLSNAKKEMSDDIKDYKDFFNKNYSSPLAALNSIRASKALSAPYGQVNKREGFFTKAFKSGKESFQNAQQQQQQGVQGTDLKGIGGNPDPQADASAKKKLIDEEQRQMKQRIDELKDALKSALSDLKDTLEKNKIAFDEGFMSIKDYYTQKAEIEAQEAQLKLQEALEERAVIERTQFSNDYEKTKALIDNKREIREFTKAVEKTGVAIKETAEVFANGAASLNDLTSYINTYGRNSASGQPTQQGMPSDISGMSNIEVAYRFLTSQGFEDAIARGIVAAMLGESLNNPQDEHMDHYGDGTPAGLSMGIAQWNGERRDALLEFARQNNSDPYHILTQLAYLVKELNDTQKAYFEEALAYYNENGQTAEAMTYAFTKFVERPADKEGEAQRRASSKVPIVNAELQTANSRPAQVTSNEPVNIETALQSALDSGFKGAQLSLGRKACTEAAVKLGSWFSDAFMKAAKDGIYHTEELDKFLEGQGIAKEEFNRDTLQPGDIIYFNNGGEKNAHVMLYQGGNKVVGNTSSANNGKGGIIQEDLDYYLKNWGMTPTFVRKTGSQGVSSNFVPGGSYQRKANTTANSSESAKKQQAFQDARLQETADAMDMSLDIYNDNFRAMLEAKFLQIKEKFRKKEQEIRTNSDNMDEASLDLQLSNLNKLMQKEIIEAENQVLDRRLHYNIAAIKTWGEYASYETFRGNLGSMQMNDFIGRYTKYFYNDVNNPLAPAFVIDKMWSQVKSLEYLGMTDKAQEMRQKILDTYNTLDQLFSNYLNHISEYYGKYRKWTDTVDMTKLQKEYANREINAEENRLKANVLGEEIAGNESILERYNQDWIDINNNITEHIKLLMKARQANDMQAVAAEERTLADLRSSAEGNKLERQKLQQKQDNLKIDKMLADNEAKHPDLLRDIKIAANQALEDGLVKFLTDGVNEAENLGEAFRNLVVGVLKEVQKVFAETISRNIMTMINPMMREKYGKANNGLKQDQFASVSGHNGIAQRNIGELYNTTVGKQYFPMATPRFDNKPWEKQDAFKQDLIQTTDYKKSALSGLTDFGSRLSLATQNVGDFGVGTQTATEALSDIAKEDSITANINSSISNATDVAATAITDGGTKVASALTSVAQNVRTSGWGGSYSLGSGNRGDKPSEGFAEGGLISGDGTGTSDSIPAMLSNGEFVISAKGVRAAGMNFLNAVNSGNFSKIRARLPKFADGGVVGEAQQETARGMTSFAKAVGTSVSTTNNMSIAVVDNKEQAMEHFMKTKGQRYLLESQRGIGRAFAQMSFSN